MQGILTRILGAFVLLVLTSAPVAQAQDWPDVFNPFQMLTLNLELSATDWDTIRRDTTNEIEVPAQFWADGETPILVSVRRKSSRALPSEADPIKVGLKVDVNELVDGQFIVGLRHHAFFKEASKAWELMREKELGLSATTTNTAHPQKVWMKNGAWGNGRQGYRTAWIAVEDKQPFEHWPEAFTAVLVTNSRLGNVVEETQPSKDLVPERVLLAAYLRGLVV